MKRCLTVLLSILGASAVFLMGCKQPEVGLMAGKLRPCPDSPNCVVSQGGDGDHAVAPIAYAMDRDKAYESIRQIVARQENASIIREEEGYLHAEFRSKLMRFVDDVEFLFPENEKVIHMRSASRVGHSDLGVNRKRMEHIRALFSAENPMGQASQGVSPGQK